MTDAHHRSAIAERAARAGGAVARELFRGSLDVDTKDNKNDLVTRADADAQEQVVATVREEFPEDDFVCEESAVPPGFRDAPSELLEAVPETGAAWVIDPIDGTANFVRGNRTWNTSVATVVDGETVGSATYMPATGDLYAAGPESATRDGDQLRVSEREDPETFAAGLTGWYDASAHAAFGDLCTATFEHMGDVRRIGSFQSTLAYVADGGLDAAICTQPTNSWDTIAGVHLVRAAGGTVTDLDGEPWTGDDEGLIASNGEAHETVLAVARGEAP